SVSSTIRQLGPRGSALISRGTALNSPHGLGPYGYTLARVMSPALGESLVGLFEPVKGLTGGYASFLEAYLFTFPQLIVQPFYVNAVVQEGSRCDFWGIRYYVDLMARYAVLKRGGWGLAPVTGAMMAYLRKSLRQVVALMDPLIPRVGDDVV